VFPIQSVGTYTIDEPAPDSLNITSKKLRQCCQRDMMAKGVYVSRESDSELATGTM
jgi:hypothetical protein